jgi:hypothetical protein
MAEYVTLTAPLYDARDPQRPRVFIAAAGQQVLKDVADRLGGEYVELKKRTPSENKKRTPPSTKKV